MHMPHTHCHLAQLHADVFDQRMQRLQEWLLPAGSARVVHRSGQPLACLHALTGEHFNNCELRTTRVSNLQLSRAL
jgi:hypothetical protein